MRHRLYLRIFVMAGLLVLAAPALAAEEPTQTGVGWILRWVNFALVFGGGGYLLRRYAPAWFHARAGEISSAIEHATRARETAEEVLRGAGEKLGNLEREAQEMRRAARDEVLAEAERIRTRAREEMERTERAADAEIVAAARAAKIELKTATARLATERAEALLRRRMSRETDAKLVRFFVASLARSVN